MRTVLPIALVMTILACHQARLGPAPSRRLGDYGFRISIAGQDPVRGAFTVTADSVMLETGGQACRLDPSRVGAENLYRFSCFPPPGLDGFDFTIDAYHPSLSRWSAVQSVMKTRTVCVRYVINQRNQRVCAETRNETYFENVRTGGGLTFTVVDTVRVH